MAPQTCFTDGERRCQPRTRRGHISGALGIGEGREDGGCEVIEEGGSERMYIEWKIRLSARAPFPRALSG